VTDNYMYMWEKRKGLMVKMKTGIQRSRATLIRAYYSWAYNLSYALCNILSLSYLDDIRLLVRIPTGWKTLQQQGEWHSANTCC